jgi:hypothetical protein
MLKGCEWRTFHALGRIFKGCLSATWSTNAYIIVGHFAGRAPARLSHLYGTDTRGSWDLVKSMATWSTMAKEGDETKKLARA